MQYKIEQITAKTKKLRHTNQIPENSIVFFITPQGEQHPFTLAKKSKEAFYLEIPEFWVTKKHQPELLQRNRYIYKTNDGIAYNFVSRPIRYEKTPEGTNYMLVAHSEKLFA